MDPPPSIDATQNPQNETTDQPPSGNKETTTLPKKSSKIFSERIILLQFLFLKLLAMAYILAFTLIFLQIPLLFGPGGFLSINQELDKHSFPFQQPKYAKYLKAPTTLWFSEDIHNVLTKYYPVFSAFTPHENMLYLICLFNIFIAFWVLVDRKGSYFVRPWTYLVMWFSYLSICTVGKSFFNTNFDKLLLEIGFLAIFFTYTRSKGSLQTDAMGVAVRELLRWLAFRYIFTIGAEKISNWGSDWWRHHDDVCDTQSYFLRFICPLFTENVLKAFALFASTTQLFTPILFYAPIRELRIWSAWIQIAIQVLEIYFGYSGLPNLLVTLLLLTVIDDHFVLSLIPKLVLRGIGIHREILETDSRPKSSVLTFILSMVIIALPFANFYFIIFIQKKDSVLNSTYLRKNIVNSYYMIVPIYSTLAFCLFSILRSWRISTQNAPIKIFKSIFTLSLFAFIFLGSLKPFLVSIQSDFQLPFVNQNLLGQINKKIEPFHLINTFSSSQAYNTELVIQGSYNNEEWKDYQFKYRSESLSDLHYPFYLQRIVWKMAEAADNSLEDELWLIHLLQQLFRGNPYLTVFLKDNPFDERLPNYLRIKRKNIGSEIEGEDYLGSVHKRDKVLNEFLIKKDFYRELGEIREELHPAEYLRLVEFELYFGLVNFLFNLVR